MIPRPIYLYYSGFLDDINSKYIISFGKLLKLQGSKKEHLQWMIIGPIYLDCSGFLDDINSKYIISFGKLLKIQRVSERLGKTIAPDDIRWEWEEKNVDLMKSLLEAKAEQCTEFKSCLLENSGKVFAEATPSKLWATGMSPFLTENTAPEFWLGRNLLGALLGELAAQLSSDGPEHMDLTPSSSSPSDETTLIGS